MDLLGVVHLLLTAHKISVYIFLTQLTIVLFQGQLEIKAKVL